MGYGEGMERRIPSFYVLLGKGGGAAAVAAYQPDVPLTYQFPAHPVGQKPIEKV